MVHTCTHQNIKKIQPHKCYIADYSSIVDKSLNTIDQISYLTCQGRVGVTTSASRVPLHLKLGAGASIPEVMRATKFTRKESEDPAKQMAVRRAYQKAVNAPGAVLVNRRSSSELSPLTVLSWWITPLLK